MYLLKSPSGTYYTRLCFPKRLRNNDFPFDTKISLYTKHRTIAVARNAALIAKLHPTVHDLPIDTAFETFKPTLATIINDVRHCFNVEMHHQLPKSRILPPTATPTSSTSIDKILDKFISSKKLESITQLTITQLEQRSKYFIDSMKITSIRSVTPAIAFSYRDLLLSEGRSYKTNLDYLAAIKQFFSWCVLNEHIATNPFLSIKLPKNRQKANQERSRWSQKDILTLYRSKAYKASHEQIKLCFDLILHHGARPAEICQLLVSQVRLDVDTPHLVLSQESSLQHLKNAHSDRLVPLHRAMLDGQFIEYVNKRKALNKRYLFDFKPLGPDQNWSKSLTTKFGKLLTKIGWKAGARPTLYGLRHTFIDELKQANVSEHLVAQIVGHTHHNMTFSRYGKDTDLQNLSEQVNKFSLKLEK
ncbi:hypothetical protein ST37_09960 [Vibrio sp. qd031]|uniref:tyrosine-type recombinase/integrase n=1 Tax=Vibrio sp. qd031 TaxID=1603038 RepID=UPI000A104CAD|nr:site-specific integrase [Vibrio sp. qd031]ORT50215.1 hypothetical protein ST37_09960 [Vibrio sp. qd031]